ncbi:peptide deformylase [Planococcus lenghuensis]|uniref:Peptide deformylase n=1 Tax=Planococcus lenghuensis TaxID=2213202 RepID=A0A1Q2L092_9BACL|nr:peptide deformylase [Planococcus lenghuensis]AQQ53851.1 peptide deformylase [Planococcus lenghuensis]
MILMKDIIREGNELLRTCAEEVSFPLAPEIEQLGRELLEYVQNSQDDDLAEKYGLRPGVGIAAPQVGQLHRLFALHLEQDNGEWLSFVAVNPKIVSHSIELAYLSTGEGCLSVDRSVPGYVPRYARITVKFKDLSGNEKRMRLKGFPAIAFQHELDHLNGVLFYDRINSDDPYAEIENGIMIDMGKDQ